MDKQKIRLTNTALHGKEERVKRIFRDQIAEAAGLLEVVLSGIVLVGLLFSIVPLIQWMPGLIVDGNEVEVYEFLTRALDIVIGIEFIKMLAKHSPGSVLEVLLYAIARHMIVGHEDAVQNLVSVAAIALIFIIRRFFFVPSFGQKLPGGQMAPDVARLYTTAEEEGKDLGEEEESAEENAYE
ncbi:transporter [Subdoligranulum variabile]|uniref:transporter n=1 Tax=Subdoligranulum variabile TaxID=214851 RepID=UPI0026EE49F0|nr:transporter [Subdoligranulum variabile]